MTASTYQVNSEQAEVFPLLRRALELLANSPLKTAVDAGCNCGRDTIYWWLKGLGCKLSAASLRQSSATALLARKTHH